MKYDRICGALALLMTLAGCFESDRPLISEAGSVTPVPAGTYSSSADTQSYVVTHSGKITSVAQVDESGQSNTSTYAMRALRDNYFVAMDRTNFQYGLLRVDALEIEELDASAFCDDVQEVAFVKDAPLSRFGVGNFLDGTCYFDSFDKLAVAFNALLDEGKPQTRALYRRSDVSAFAEQSAAPAPEGAAASLAARLAEEGLDSQSDAAASLDWLRRTAPHFEARVRKLLGVDAAEPSQPAP